MIPIEKGHFKMPTYTKSDIGHEKRDVLITKNFWMSRNEITIGEFLYYLRHSDNESDTNFKNYINWKYSKLPITSSLKMKYDKGATWGNLKQPIVGISWKAANQFCKWLTERERKAGRLQKGYEYRLPTEAEWVYSAFAGSKKNISVNSDHITLDSRAVYQSNSQNKTSSVGTRKSNAWGLNDMYGNAWEWCNDWFTPELSDLAIKDPTGPVKSNNNLKVIVGGGYTTSRKSFTKPEIP